jgi:hypothetical protein
MRVLPKRHWGGVFDWPSGLRATVAHAFRRPICGGRMQDPFLVLDARPWMTHAPRSKEKLASSESGFPPRGPRAALPRIFTDERQTCRARDAVVSDQAACLGVREITGSDGAPAVTGVATPSKGRMRTSRFETPQRRERNHGFRQGPICNAPLALARRTIVSRDVPTGGPADEGGPLSIQCLSVEVVCRAD